MAPSHALVKRQHRVLWERSWEGMDGVSECDSCTEKTIDPPGTHSLTALSAAIPCRI